MAGTQITTDLSELESQRAGYNGLSFDDWTDGAAPTIDGYTEINGGLYFFNAESIDVAAAWGGIANSTLVYLYINPATIVPYISTTAPAWDETKNGYYLAASPTHRCYGQIYKDSAGNYDQKTIVTSKGYGITNVGVNLGIGANADRDIILASDYSLTWDESESGFANIQSYKSQDGGADVQLFQYVTAIPNSSSDFTIKKPCSVRLESSIVTPDIAYVELKINGGYIPVGTELTQSFRANNIIDSAWSLNPGTYRITNQDSGTTTLYAVGVYGATAVTAADIVV